MEASDTAADLAAKAAAAAQIVRRIQAGEAEAEAELVTRYGRGVRFLLLQLTGDPTRTDDLYQETFRLVLEKVRGGDLREPEKLPGFLRHLARNLFLGEIRRGTRRPTADLDEIEPPADPGPSPLARLLAAEDARLARELLQELEPARDREVLFRFYLASEPKERICASLGLGSQQFNLVIHRARQRFKALLERSLGPGGKGA
jgi:RNA polymerase sigma-70 factor (ECF subfamily)